MRAAPYLADDLTSQKEGPYDKLVLVRRRCGRVLRPTPDFTKLAAEHVSDGLGALIVEGTATVAIALYLLVLWLTSAGTQRAAGPGVFYSVLTGICVGAGTVMFFLLFQKGGPLSAVPIVLAGGAAIMTIVGILFFKEPATWPRMLGIILSIAGLFFLRMTPVK